MFIKKPRDLKAIGITSLLVAAVLIAKTISEGYFGSVGPDSDDTMRLVQVRDFLAGQGWFDTTQYRMGPEGGTLMHWSRIADLPLIVLIGFFDLFLPTSRAESMALIVWPLICAVLTIYGILVGIRHLGGQKAIPVACLLLFIALIGYSRFQPGAIDHHNFQLALIAIAIGHALDPDRRSRSYAIGAVAMGLSLAIGPEVYFFIAVLCGFFALQWLLNPLPVQKSTRTMGLVLIATLTVVFFGTIAPANYGAVYCDSFSLITYLACLAGGLGLASAAHFLSKKTLGIRFAALTGLAILCALIFLLQAPQCLANPLDILPEDVRVQWLEQIQEAQPLFKNSAEWATRVPYALGPMVVALILSILKIKTRNDVTQYALLLALLVLCTGLMIYQLRFMVFGHLVSLLVLGPWVALIYQDGKTGEGANIKYIAALAAAIPVFWALPGVLLGTQKSDPLEISKSAGSCYSKDVLTALNALDPGLVIAMENDTPVLLRHTHHRVLTGNYHRNVEGIADGLSILKNPPEAAQSILNKHKADYFLYCDITMANSEFVTNYPQSLTAQIAKKAIPDYMEVIREDLEGGGVRIYRIKT